MTDRAKLVVLSGPSGVGKTTIAELLCRTDRFEESVSATTRPPRDGEEDGRHYHFLDEKGFRRRDREGAFLEQAVVHGHRYGTLRSEVERILRRGRHCILNIDVQGAKQLMDSRKDAVFVFLLPPDLETLESRLRERSTDSEEDVRSRLDTALRELEQQELYDHRIVNDVAGDAASRVAAIVQEATSPDRSRRA